MARLVRMDGNLGHNAGLGENMIRLGFKLVSPFERNTRKAYKISDCSNRQHWKVRSNLTH